MEREITLLVAVRKMDGHALTGVFEYYAPALYKYAYRLCNNAVMADQIVGDVFERFIQQISADRNPCINLRTHLYEIAYGIMIHDVRYMNFLLPSDGALWHRNWLIPNTGSDEDNLLNTIERAIIHSLTDDQRHVLLLRFAEGFSLKETAAIMGKKVNNVKVIQNRAVAALRKALDYSVGDTHTITLCLRRMAQA
jgi:RNA polymerase sigma-70 factor (ECF subfamily)